MGDYGFEGAGEFGGNDFPMSEEVLKDINGKFNYMHCPHRKIGLNGDADNSFSCENTWSPDADGRGSGYEGCKFSGGDYRECPLFKVESRRVSDQKALDSVLEDAQEVSEKIVRGYN